MGDRLIAQLFMQCDADRIRVGDTGTQITDILASEAILECMVQRRSNTLSVTGLADVDGGLDRPAVGGACLEGGGVGVADGLTAVLGDEVGIAFQRMSDALPELLCGGGDIFKGDGGILDIWGINAS